MKSQLISSIDIDHDELAKEVEIISQFDFNGAYDDFVCGELKSCILWNQSGDSNDTLINNYESNAQITPHGKLLPYIQELIKNHFKLENLRFARILLLTPNSVFIPHRDYLELKSDFLRFHIPLKTDDHCFNSEENLVYQMKIGEIWYINATKVHSAASFSKQNRMHLILDFDYKDSLAGVMRVPVKNPPVIPESSIFKRMDFSENKIDSILSLYKLIDNRNFYDVLSIIIKQYFRMNMKATMIFDWFLTICNLSKDEAIIRKAEKLREYCLLKREYGVSS